MAGVVVAGVVAGALCGVYPTQVMAYGRALPLGSATGHPEASPSWFIIGA